MPLRRSVVQTAQQRRPLITTRVQKCQPTNQSRRIRTSNAKAVSPATINNEADIRDYERSRNQWLAAPLEDRHRCYMTLLDGHLQKIATSIRERTGNSMRIREREMLKRDLGRLLGCICQIEADSGPLLLLPMAITAMYLNNDQAVRESDWDQKQLEAKACRQVMKDSSNDGLNHRARECVLRRCIRDNEDAAAMVHDFEMGIAKVIAQLRASHNVAPMPEFCRVATAYIPCLGVCLLHRDSRITCSTFGD